MIGYSEGVYKDLTDDDYHGDAESLSSSGARALLEPSCPALFDHDRRHRVTKKEFDFGHAAHSLVLGVGAPIREIKFDDWRTKASQQARDEARAEGATPLLTKDLAIVKAMAAAIVDNPIAKELYRKGDPEWSYFWRNPEHGVMMRARPDWQTRYEGEFVLVDYKTSHTAGPVGFKSTAKSLGYHQQDAWYVDTLTGLSLAEPNTRFLFVSQCKKAPYLTTVCEFEPDDRADARVLNNLALSLYAECQRTGQWPGYDGIHPITLRYRRAQTAPEEYFTDDL